jgi:hypothetical protein
MASRHGAASSAGHAQQRSIPGDDEVNASDLVTIERLQFRAGHCRGMREVATRG